MPLYYSSYLRTLPRERHTHCTRVTNLVSLSSQRRVWYAPTGRPSELEVLDVTNKTTALFGGYGALLVGAADHRPTIVRASSHVSRTQGYGSAGGWVRAAALELRHICHAERANEMARQKGGGRARLGRILVFRRVYM
jgi:hypothetical protein